MTLDELKLAQDWKSFLDYRSMKLVGIQSGIEALDRALLTLSGVVIVQGAPGCNKSTLALQIAQHNATLGNPTLVIDRENGVQRLRERLICMANRVSRTDVLTCDRERLKALIRTIVPYPIYAETRPVKSYEVIKGWLDEMWAAHQRPMLLVVDSLQKLPRLNPDPRHSLEEWMTHLDQLKLDFKGNLVVIAASEKSRGEGGLNYERAAMGAGKGSGEIEYTGEIVLDLRRNYEDGSIICEVVKNRDGLSGVAVPLRPVLAQPTNKQSFCFRLEAGGTE